METEQLFKGSAPQSCVHLNKQGSVPLILPPFLRGANGVHQRAQHGNVLLKGRPKLTHSACGPFTAWEKM